jgi:hypothetical protein
MIHHIFLPTLTRFHLTKKNSLCLSKNKNFFFTLTSKCFDSFLKDETKSKSILLNPLQNVSIQHVILFFLEEANQLKCKLFTFMGGDQLFEV